MTAKRGVLLTVFVICVWAIASDGDYEAELRNQQHYCEMVNLHIESDGENGWPDYRGYYWEVCNGE